MTMLTKWDPLRELEAVSDHLSSYLNRREDKSTKSGDRDWFATAEWTPRVDISEDDQSYLIEAELPHVNKDDIALRVADGVLTITGEREFKNEDQTKKYHRIERSYGRFVRSFVLPEEADPEKVHAEYANGILTVRVDKSEARKPRQIDIKVK